VSALAILKAEGGGG
jgi:hypothetical protein